MCQALHLQHMKARCTVICGRKSISCSAWAAGRCKCQPLLQRPPGLEHKEHLKQLPEHCLSSALPAHQSGGRTVYHSC